MAERDELKKLPTTAAEFRREAGLLDGVQLLGEWITPWEAVWRRPALICARASFSWAYWHRSPISAGPGAGRARRHQLQHGAGAAHHARPGHGRALILGAGVAGLQAIATARRLGAVVSAFDVRPAVKEQVQSLGATFLQIEMPQKDTEDAGGYAKALSEEAHRREVELLSKAERDMDVVITTALVPGRQARAGHARRNHQRLVPHPRGPHRPRAHPQPGGSGAAGRVS